MIPSRGGESSSIQEDDPPPAARRSHIGVKRYAVAVFAASVWKPAGAM